MNAILKNYIIKKYGLDDFQNIVNNNRLQCIFIEDPLNSMFLSNKANVISLKNELIKTTSNFQNKGIKYITFKGVVLANRLYDNIYIRCFSDIDIFVNPENFDKALTILYEDGYSLRYLESLQGLHHIVLKKGTIVLELHKNILNPFTKIDETYMREHTENVVISNQKIRTFDITK